MSLSIQIGGVEIIPEFRESYVKFIIPAGEPLPSETKVAISNGYDVPVLFQHHYGKTISKTWFTNGIAYCPFGYPSYEETDRTKSIAEYRNSDGVLTNKLGPAKIRKNSSGYCEEWYDNGFWKRVGGPAYIDIDYPTPPNSLFGWKTDTLQRIMTWGQILDFINAGYDEHYFGKEIGQPGIWCPPRPDAKCTYPLEFEFTVDKRKEMLWCEDEDSFCRKDGSPDSVDECISAERTYNVGTTIYRKVFSRRIIHQWHDRTRDGVLHRTVAPSSICLYNVRRLYSGSRLVDIKAQDWDWDWQLNGNIISKLKIMQWAKNHSIPLKHGPLYGKESIFYKPEDEVCFMADFG